MESPPKHSPKTTPYEDDIDLGKLFNKTGGMITSFFNWLGRGFINLGNFSLGILFLLRRHFIWLLAGIIAGVGVGAYFQSKNGIRYTSKMTVRANFNSTRTLYSTIDYFNGLINNRQTGQLSKIFNITPAEASSLLLFEATPIESEKIVSELYTEQFIRQERNSIKRMDTFWIKAIPYQNYKKSLTKYDYPLQDIILTSSNAMIFPKIQQGIVNEVSSNTLLQEMKNAEANINNNEVELLISSIKSLDTLKNVYNKRLTALTEKETGNNLTLVEGRVDVRAPELELYDKLLELKNELKTAKQNSVLESDILMVYAPFGIYGEKEGILKRNITRWSIIGFLSALIIILLIAFYKYITDLEKKLYKTKQSLPRQ